MLYLFCNLVSTITCDR